MNSDHPETLDLLLTRRSVLVKNLKSPGPSAEQIDWMLRCAHRVPDHKKLGPWRFIVFQGDARQAFGEHLASEALKKNPEGGDKLAALERNRFMRAPLVIAVIASPAKEEKAPLWEQYLSTGAACQNLLLAATAMGFGAQWVTEWYSYDASIATVMGLSEEEKIAGYIYVGAYDEKPSERVRPDLNARVHYWQAE